MLCKSGNSRRGFTLVELLAVVFIIGLLVAILLPAIGSVRTSAKKTATTSNIASITLGLESFRTTQELGTKYPPSASDQRFGGVSSVSNPFRESIPAHPGGNSRIEMSGAGLLFAAMTGFDGLGTAGFKQTRSNSNGWSQDTNDRYDSGTPSESGLYALDNNGQPVHRRYGPFVDSQSVTTTSWDAEQNKFSIPLEESNAPRQVQRRDYPMFLDAFGAPILYWRADRGGRLAVDGEPDGLDANERGIYHFSDNGALLSDRYASTQQSVLRTHAVDGNEPLHYLDQDKGSIDGTMKPETVLEEPASWNAARPNAFLRHILDKGVTVRMQPQKADSFILLSPGADRIYGTKDDIGNIQPNGGWE